MDPATLDLLLDPMTYLRDAAEKALKDSPDQYWAFLREEMGKMPKEEEEEEKKRTRGRKPKAQEKKPQERKKKKGGEFVSIDGFQLEFEKRMDATAESFDGDRLRMYASSYQIPTNFGFDEDDDETRTGNMFRRWLRGEIAWTRCKDYYKGMINWDAVENIIANSPLVVKEQQNLAEGGQLNT